MIICARAASGLRLPCQRRTARRGAPVASCLGCCPAWSHLLGRCGGAAMEPDALLGAFVALRLRPRWNRLPLTSDERIIISHSRPFPVPVTFHPLQELQVVLILATDEIVDGDVPFDEVLVECSLQNLEVRYEFMIRLRHPVYLPHCDGVGVAGVEDLTVDSPAGTLFHLGDAHLEQRVDPCDE